MNFNDQHDASFRDPSGYVFIEDNSIKRIIFPIYFKQYYALKTSGFFENLFKNKLLIKHQEISTSDANIIIQPEYIPFITYPYEWSFYQYKEAALLTLKLQKYSLEQGFTLKDASAFNVTFYNGHAVFIDTLSFDFYEATQPWRAYKQFISHFLGPLLLAKYHGTEALTLIRNFMDGIPVKIIASMLPFKTKLSPFIYSHIHLLAAFENKHKDTVNTKEKAVVLTKKAQLNIIKNLYNSIRNITLNKTSEWGNYYQKINYTDAAFKEKSTLLNTWIDTITANTLIDIGGNDGTFVRYIKRPLQQALVCDVDNNAVDANYKKVKQDKESYILPFVLDVLNPSSSIGFSHKERMSFLTRIKALSPDVTLALAIIHHITLSGNIPFHNSAHFFALFSNYLIIEFPQQEDSWVQHLLNRKGDFKNHFNFYNTANFENAYSEYFKILEKNPILNSERIMYLLKVKDGKKNS